jgi:hypothetical protein
MNWITYSLHVLLYNCLEIWVGTEYNFTLCKLFFHLQKYLSSMKLIQLIIKQALILQAKFLITNGFTS